MKLDRIHRFSAGERFFHWANAGLYGVLFVTGTLLLIGRIFTLANLPYALVGKIHRTCGVMLVGLLSVILLLSASVPTFRELWKTLRQCLVWKVSDVVWLLKVPINMIFPKCSLPPVGRFNPGQKMHLLVVFAALLGLSVSGLIMIWIPGALGAWVIHLVCFVPVLLFLSLHLFLSLINPATRKALPAMFTGFINAHYARSHHSLWDDVSEGTSMHGSYVSWKWVCVVGILLLAGVGFAVHQHGFNTVISDLNALVANRGSSAILPGPLCAAHGSEEDLKACRACHSVFRSVQDQPCLTCHLIIAGRLQEESGFHGTLLSPCRDCHAEHEGQEASLIDLKATDFTHDKALFALEGQHRAVDCEACHARDEEPFRYIGIDFASCVSCHPDPHQEEEVTLCQDCHTPDTWSFEDKVFDHTTDTAFELKGRHQALDCRACHDTQDAAGEPRVQLLGLGRVCSDCHDDPHEGQFVQACDQCHSEDGFRDIRPEQFHGDPDTFLLAGQHARLRCQACHVIPEGQDILAQAKFAGLGRDCSDCHEDPHAGQFADTCDHCHTEDGFRNIRAEQFHGDPDTFILKARHAQLKCQACHESPEGQHSLGSAKFTGLGKTCADCHRDPHQARMDHACETCHQENGFAGVNLLFVHDQHTGFVLDGQHKVLRCEACHTAGGLLYEAAGIECQDCHGVEAQALAGQASTLHVKPDWHFNRVTCADCHDLSTAKPSTQDLAARCADCHTPHYQSLLRNWQESLGKRQQGLEARISQSALTPSQRASLEQRISEARRIGSHHMPLAQELLKQLDQEIGSTQ